MTAVPSARRVERPGGRLSVAGGAVRGGGTPPPPPPPPPPPGALGLGEGDSLTEAAALGATDAALAAGVVAAGATVPASIPLCDANTAAPPTMRSSTTTAAMTDIGLDFFSSFPFTAGTAPSVGMRCAPRHCFASSRPRSASTVRIHCFDSGSKKYVCSACTSGGGGGG